MALVTARELFGGGVAGSRLAAPFFSWGPGPDPGGTELQGRGNSCFQSYMCHFLRHAPGSVFLLLLLFLALETHQ